MHYRLPERDVRVIGLGFGPSNLALAVTNCDVAEGSGQPPIDCLFLEQQVSWSWHPGMLLEDTNLQVSFLKDLVTMRNPRSRFTFLCYLQEQGRLHEFINLRDFFPLRVEFDDYLKWAAHKVKDVVRYGQRVESVEPVFGDGGVIERLMIQTQETDTGAQARYRAQDLVLGLGGTPFVPRITARDDARVFHSSAFLMRLQALNLDSSQPLRVAVIGAGQSGAEIVEYLLNTHPQAEVHAVLREASYRQSDDSPFVNEIFYPDAVDRVFALSPQARHRILEEHQQTNYAVIDKDLIERLYKKAYQDRVLGRQRLMFHPHEEVVDVHRAGGGGLVLQLRQLLSGVSSELAADVVVFATGYHWPADHPILRSLGEYFRRDSEGRVKIDRSYQIETTPELRSRIFLQGYCEESHGIGETLLSLLPFRASRILERVSQPVSIASD